MIVLQQICFQQAAEQDHGHAQYSLGLMFAFGRGVDRDYDIAREWFIRSADKGIAQAQYNLGIFYENGNGVEADLNQAKEWYQRAGAQGLNEAIEKLASLNSNVETEPMHNIIETDTNENTAVLETTSVDTGYDYSEIATTGIRREKWVMDQSTDSYTIQIGSVVNEDDLIHFLKRHNIEDNSAYIQVIIDGATRYNAFYGIFASYQEAEIAVSDLPTEIQRASPWIRNIGILQKLIN